MRSTALVIALLLSTACSTFGLRSDRCPAYAPATPDPAAVKVQYLGSGGYLVGRGDDVVLFGPVYSNPGLTEVGFDHQIRTDRGLVDQLLPPGASQADAIVIGHGHYDHAMDTPYIANEKAKAAQVFGSATLKNMIQSEVAPSRIVDVASYAGDAVAKTPAKPIKINEHLRLWPIKSQHSDQSRLKIGLFGLNVPMHMWRGEVTKAQSTLPTNVSGWAEGEVYSYVLDFMEGDKVTFRLYYQDSGTDEPIGYPLLDETAAQGRPIDVVLVCVGGDFEYLSNHPEGIITATKPRFVVLGHWENFFKPQTDICRINKVDAIPHFNVNEFVGEAKDAIKENAKSGQTLKYDPILACPNASVFYFPAENANDRLVHDAIKKSPVTYDCSKIIPRSKDR